MMSPVECHPTGQYSDADLGQLLPKSHDKTADSNFSKRYFATAPRAVIIRRIARALLESCEALVACGGPFYRHVQRVSDMHGDGLIDGARIAGKGFHIDAHVIRDK